MSRSRFYKISKCALKFIQDQLNCDHRQAFKWGAEWLGRENTTIRTYTQQTPSATARENSYQRQEWMPVFPAPSTSVNLQAEPQLLYMLKGRQETARYAYKDAEGNVLGYVLRLEDKHGQKINPTLTYCQNDKGEMQWRWQGFGNDRPLYGLEQIKQKPEATILVVEGEKTAEAGKMLFPYHAVVTWSGGCGSVHKSDWSVLKDRDVTIWPDNDQPGINAAAKIAEILNAQGNEQVKTVDLPSTLPHKWDLADHLPEGLDAQEILHQTIEKQSVTISKEIPKGSLGIDAVSEQQQDQERIDSILNYLKTELTVEKHFWLDDQQIQYFKNIAERDPQEALKNGNMSVKIIASSLSPKRNNT